MRYIIGKDDSGKLIVGIIRKSDDYNYDLIKIDESLSDKKYRQLFSQTGWRRRNTKNFTFYDKSGELYEFSTVLEQFIKKQDDLSKMVKRIKEAK